MPCRTPSYQTTKDILARHGPPAPERKKRTTWSEFVLVHLHILPATDLFTAELWTHAGRITDHVLFFVHLATRKVRVAGITACPDTS